MGLASYFQSLGQALVGKQIIGSKPLLAAAGEEWWPWGKQVSDIGNTADFYKLNVAVYACVKIRADNVAGVPLAVYRRGPDGPQPVPDTHPFQELITKVNPFWSRGRFWRATETALSLWGSSFWALERRGQGRPVEMWWLRPDRVSVVPDAREYVKGFIYRSGLHEIAFGPDEVIWLQYMNPYDEFSGLSPLEAARIAVESNQEALKWNRQFFRNDATPGRVYMQTKDALTPTQAKELQERWKKLHQGPDQAHRMSVLDSGTELKTLGIPQKDMEFLAMQRYTLEDICRIFRVPPPMVADLERATYANIREAKASFWHETMLPELRFIAEEVNEFLAPMFGPDLYVDFDTSGIEALKQDETARVDRQVKLVTSGLRTINELRTEDNLDPLEWGDSWWAPLGLMPADPERQVPSLLEAFGLSPRKAIADLVRYMGNGDVKRRDALPWPKLAVQATMELWWETRVKRLDGKETLFVRAVRQFFAGQEDDVLERLQNPEKQIQRLTLFDPTAWEPLLANWIRPVYEEIMLEAGNETRNDFSLPGSWDLRNPRVQRWLGQKVKNFSRDVNRTTAEAIANALAEGEAQGESIPQLAQRIRQVFDQANISRAETIARTETVAASNKANMEVYQQSGVVERKEWLTALDHRTRGGQPGDLFDHISAHGQQRPLDEPFEVSGEFLDAPGDNSRGASPGNTINCVLSGNTAMAVGILAASKAKYTGPALKLRTQNGRVLTITPNHLILTDHGFIAGYLVRPGNQLICSAISQGVIGSDEQVANMPPMIEQVFSAFDVVSGARRVRRLAGVTDFYGDGRNMDSDVEVVMADRQLRCTCNSPIAEPVHDYAFCGISVLKSALTDDSPTKQLVFGANHPSDLIMSRLTEALTLGNRGAAHTGEHASTAITWANTTFKQMTPDDRPADVCALRDSLLAFPSQIALDELVEVSEFHFSGYVYDLQTISGLYNSNGIFVHNCRCSVVPVIE